MINKTISALILLFMLISVADLALGQQKALSSKGGKATYKYPAKKSTKGNTNLFNKHQQFHNKHYRSHQDFHNKYYKPHPGTKAYNDKYYGNKHGKKHYYKKHKKHGYYNKPHGGYVYYGYNNYYPGDYYYEDIPYDGYGSTLGTVPRRPSNLEVNNYVYGPDYENNDQGYYPEDQYGYQGDYVQEDYSYAPGPESRTIYIWTDEFGVEHFVNDPNLVPDQFWGDVRIVDEY